MPLWFWSLLSHCPFQGTPNGKGWAQTKHASQGRRIHLLARCLVKGKFQQIRLETAEVSMCSTRFHDLIHDAIDKSESVSFLCWTVLSPVFSPHTRRYFAQGLGYRFICLRNMCAGCRVFRTVLYAVRRLSGKHILFLRANMYLIGWVPRQRKENPSVFSLLVS